MTTKPFKAVIRADGTWTILCMVFAPTRSPPKNIEAGMVAIGWKLPKQGCHDPIESGIARESYG